MADTHAGQPGQRFMPRYDRGSRAVIIGAPSVTFTLAIAYLAIRDWDAGAALLGVAIVASGVYWSVLPRAYVLEADRLLIVLGWPWALNLPFNTINEFRPGRECPTAASRSSAEGPGNVSGKGPASAISGGPLPRDGSSKLGKTVCFNPSKPVTSHS